MMKCEKCGNVNNQGNFCTVCGNNLGVMNTNVTMNNSYPQQPNSNQNMGMVNIYRENNFVGIIVPFDIFVDGFLMGTVANDSTTQVPLYFGTHTIEIKQGLNKSAVQQIVVNEQNRVINMTVSMKMGLFQNKLEISNIVVGR